MAIAAQPLLIGIDVSKHHLHICQSPDQPLQVLDNTPKAIRQWLKSLPPGPVSIALEATGIYHLELLHQAHAHGHTLYLIDGYRLSRYRDSLGQRAKTDTHDARLLHRHLAHEGCALRPWSPPPAGFERLQRLMRRRTSLVEARVRLQQSLADIPDLKRTLKALLRQIQQIEQRLQNALLKALKDAGWDQDRKRCQNIEGVGPLTAAGLTYTYHRGQFANSDAFIAYLGMDVQVRDSGKLRGRRKLTKKGDPQLRRLLFLAAMQASRTATWRDFYQRHQQRGLSKIQALVALARKLARVAFALLRNQSQYLPISPQQACAET